MVNLFLAVFEVSVSVSLLIAVLVIFAPFLNRRYAVKWKYWIWIFLAFRLIIPVRAERALGDLLSQMTARTFLKENNIISPLAHRVPLRRIIIEIPAQMTAPIGGMESAQNTSEITPLGVMAILWMLGGIVFILVHLFSYLHYKKQVLKRGVLVKDVGILRKMLELKRELHIKGEVHVIEYAGAVSPMIMGFLKIFLVLPKARYDTEELYFILKHELVHLKRRDGYIKLLFVAAHAVHWFDPLVWIMQKEAEIDMELSCDERVVQGEDFTRRKAYTETLLSTLHKQCTKQKYLSTKFYGGKQIMKKRFKNILIRAGKKNGAVIFAGSVILTLSLGTLAGCSVAKDVREDASGQTENNGQPIETDINAADESVLEDMPYAEDASNSGTVDIVPAEDKSILTIMKEGEPEEKEAALTAMDGYSFYLPDGEWQMDGSGSWQAVVNESVRLWAAKFENSTQVKEVLIGEGYTDEEEELVKQEGEIVYKAKIFADEEEVWCVFYCYPVEAEEGWGRELPVIADTFAVAIS